jgi:hypothetical protein
MIISRKIQENIEKVLFQGKIVIIYGARQVGKTTLAKEILKKYPDSAYLNCDEPDIKAALTDKTSTELKEFLGDKKLIVLDEAQRVENIGLILKLIADNIPDTQIIATGSSSFDLSNKINEPLTGRKYEFYLYPFSIGELAAINSEMEISRLIERRMIFGMYPDIALNSAESELKLKNLAKSYLYKDVLQFQNIRHSEAIEKLLTALALQAGNEVSYNELGQIAGIDKLTAASYVKILEQAFIIFKLSPFSRNLRNELKKMRKIYFIDNGIRNALINNFNPINLRQDTGSLWENFIISERIKYLINSGQNKNFYFWRTREGGEIDWLEEGAGVLSGFEIKWNEEKFKLPKQFQTAYPHSAIKLINRRNFMDFLV